MKARKSNQRNIKQINAMATLTEKLKPLVNLKINPQNEVVIVTVCLAD